MNRLNKYIVRVLMVGFICLAVVVCLLFWARKTCRLGLAALSYWSYDWRQYDKIVTMDLLPEYEYEPNVIENSYAWARVNRDMFLGADLGISAEFEGEVINIFRRKTGKYAGNGAIIFDKKRGWYIYCSIYGSTARSGVIRVHAYAGPEGAAPLPGDELGRFEESIAWLIVEREDQEKEAEEDEQRHPLLLAYDNKQGCIVRIDFDNQKVQKGPQLIDINSQPVQIGQISKYNFVNISWAPTRLGKVDSEGVIRPVGAGFPAKIGNYFNLTRPNWLPLLTADGQIYRLDTEKLQVTGRLGYLPLPQRPDIPSFSQAAAPAALLDYDIMPLFINEQYRGLFTAAIDRKGGRLSLAVFDDRVGNIASRNTDLNKVIRRQSYGPLYQVTKFILESIHPPVLSVASVFSAGMFSVEDGYRGIFLLPDAYVAGFGNKDESIFLRLFEILFIMSPALLLAAYLCSLVGRDAAAVGLSRDAIRWWMTGTIAFGLVGYITYRLTRPTIRLVTCRNCGNRRRPDQQLCHRCRADWEYDELAAPAWRVFDGVDTQA